MIAGTADVGIYWNNHHHLFQLTERISGGVLWANLHLLFWLSLFPFTTAWMDRSHFSRTPVIVFGINLLAAAIAYYLLDAAIWVSLACYVAVAVLWLVPDRRIERVVR